MRKREKLRKDKKRAGEREERRRCGDDPRAGAKGGAEQKRLLMLIQRGVAARLSLLADRILAL